MLWCERVEGCTFIIVKGITGCNTHNCRQKAPIHCCKCVVVVMNINRLQVMMPDIVTKNRDNGPGYCPSQNIG